MDIEVSGGSPGRYIAFVGAAFALGGLAAIWWIRMLTPGNLYVSGLGATGMPLSTAFGAALGVLGFGGVLLGVGGAWVAAQQRATVGPSWVIVSWVALVISGCCFIVAALVPCSPGCPVPGSEFFTRSDFIHLTTAITGFVLICLVMLLRAAVARGRRRVAAGAALIATAASSGVGGLLALAGFDAGILEFTAMTIAVCWAVADTFFALTTARLRIEANRTGSSQGRRRSAFSPERRVPPNPEPTHDP